MPADPLLDANGVAITVGATVKLVGVVTSVNALDNRYNSVAITLLHPIAGVPDVGSSPGAEGVKQSGKKTIEVTASMLVVGA